MSEDRSEFVGLGAKVTGHERLGNCHRCGGLVSVLLRRDQQSYGFLAHESPADCLRQGVEGGLKATVYDARDLPAGVVKLGTIPWQRHG